MRVAFKLRAAFALYTALMAAVLVFHVRTNRRAVERGRALASVSSRVRVTSTVQPERLSQMSSVAEKYLVTRDGGYLEKLVELAIAHGEELERLQTSGSSGEERAQLLRVVERWRHLEAEVLRLTDASGQSSEVALEVVGGLDRPIGELQALTMRLTEASRTTMARELAAAERSARTAERVSWFTAVGALLSSLLLTALLIRSIVRPLQTLTQGTREVSASRFAYRLDASGTDEFAQVATDFNAMTERLGELDRMKRDFVSNVSHDLKTPLSSMQETIDVMLDELPGPLSETQRRLLSLNQESARRLSSMVSKLLELSRIESVPARKARLVDVGRLARDAVDRATGWPGRKPVVKLIASDAQPRLLHADDEAIAQLLDNLLENAVKFSPPAGTVRVTVGDTNAQGGVLITVADEGPGIPDAEKERVFDRFYQTEAGRAVASRGAGLGLSICKHIVEQHEGAIWVTDYEPRGSVFCVLLPGSASVAREELAGNSTLTGSAA
ncbi:MAG: HAMP domain-containing sensor histidine kinase [Gemmatimonadaceae bacterium]